MESDKQSQNLVDAMTYGGRSSQTEEPTSDQSRETEQQTFADTSSGQDGSLIESLTYGGRDPHGADLDQDQEFPLRGIH